MTDEVQNTTPPPVPPTGDKPYDSDDGIFLFLAYFGIFSLIPFFMNREKRDNPKKEYVYFHARQGLAIAIVAFCAAIVLMFGAFVLAFIPVLGWILDCLLWLGFMAIFFGSSIIGWIKAFKGEKYEIPGFSKVANMFG
jgi:uncharacterized membrane protein